MQHRFLTGRSLWITHLIGWALVGSIFYSLLSGVRPPLEALARTCINLVFMAVLFYGNARWLVNGLMEKGRYGALVFWGLLLCALAALARTWVEMYFFKGVFFATGRITSPAQLFLIFFISFFLLVVFSTLYQLTENRQILEVQHSQLLRSHAEAQLNYLKARINPHFLFNSLNNIYAAASLQHPRTPDMVLRLSELLRYVTYDAAATAVPLEKELDQIRAYLDLYQMSAETIPDIRLETDVRYDWEIEPVLLLPLVENAIKHGDLGQQPQAFVQITLHTDEKRLFFEVKNSFNPENRQKDTVGGVGLENVRQRLALHPQQRGTLRTTAIDHLFTATLELIRQT